LKIKYERRCSMGRGDKRSKKGKIFAGSFGKSRPQKKGKKNKSVKTQAKA
jgi:30S ribosomal protein S31